MFQLLFNDCKLFLFTFHSATQLFFFWKDLLFAPQWRFICGGLFKNDLSKCIQENINLFWQKNCFLFWRDETLPRNTQPYSMPPVALCHAHHYLSWRLTMQWSSPDSMTSSFSQKSCSQTQVEYKRWMRASVNRNIWFQSHSPLGLGKVIPCFRTRWIQEPLIKTMSSALGLFPSLLLSLSLSFAILFSFPSLFTLQLLSEGLCWPDLRC